MRAVQQLLLPDPRPLVERLGASFFQSLPRGSGVYLMRDGGGAVLYVGKALSLRRRLACYRVANPDRVPRRHLRLLRLVAHIEVELCANEEAALRRESELLRTLRPPFNRAGTWPSTPRHFCWRFEEGMLWLAVSSAPIESWCCHGPMGRRAFHLRDGLARLIWLATHPGSGHADLPFGWMEGAFEDRLAFPFTGDGPSLSLALASLLNGDSQPFEAWLQAHLAAPRNSFDRRAVERDAELIGLALERKNRGPQGAEASRESPVKTGKEVGAASRT